MSPKVCTAARSCTRPMRSIAKENLDQTYHSHSWLTAPAKQSKAMQEPHSESGFQQKQRRWLFCIGNLCALRIAKRPVICTDVGQTWSLCQRTGTSDPTNMMEGIGQKRVRPKVGRRKEKRLTKSNHTFACILKTVEVGYMSNSSDKNQKDQTSQPLA